MAQKCSSVFLVRQCLFSNYFKVFNSQSRLSSAESKPEEAVFALEEVANNIEEDEAVIEAKRNKSGLADKERDILFGIPPPADAYDFHKSIKYKRKIYGLYGAASGIDPGTLWPNKSDIDEIREYESVAYPNSFHDTLSMLKEKRAEKERIIQARQKKIAENLNKVNQWIKEVEARKEKKLKELAASKQKRDTMLEEVRKQLGYNIDVKDERFKLAMMQKEKDMKKKLKEEKAKAKQERLLKSLSNESVSL